MRGGGEGKGRETTGGRIYRHKDLKGCDDIVYICDPSTSEAEAEFHLKLALSG